MSDLSTRISEILGSHRIDIGVTHGDYCRCGVDAGRSQDDLDVHVTALIIEAIKPDIRDVSEAIADADDGIIFGLLTPDEAQYYWRMARAAVAAMGIEEKS